MRTVALYASLLALATTNLASAQDASAATGDAPPPGASPYVRKVMNGVRLAATRDLDGASSALREAIQEQPSSAMAYYYLGEVQRMRGENDRAIESFERCRGFASGVSDALYEARCLRGKADTLERMTGRLEDAREAWNEYVRFADSHRQASSPEIGRARVQSIDAVLELGRAYVEVRERIAARERENARGSRPAQRTQGGR